MASRFRGESLSPQRSLEAMERPPRGESLEARAVSASRGRSKGFRAFFPFVCPFFPRHVARRRGCIDECTMEGINVLLLGAVARE